MTTPTPTDADRALAVEQAGRLPVSLREFVDYGARCAVQARRQGEEAILKIIREEHANSSNDNECCVAYEYGDCSLCNAIRALPTGETK